MNPDPAVAARARATELLRQNPETGFDGAIDEAVVTLGPERVAAATAAASGVAETTETADAADAAEPAETTESTEAAKAAKAEETADC
ncbi:hypothetical protein ABZS86_34540 [Streptomyces sp. NPDC005355]|uniref:hypothetical protein n=1 Tax=Streptomyces sp. NPDC005355 TaxID=3157038 RepID=UPI0033AECF3F